MSKDQLRSLINQYLEDFSNFYRHSWGSTKHFLQKDRIIDESYLTHKKKKRNGRNEKKKNLLNSYSQSKKIHVHHCKVINFFCVDTVPVCNGSFKLYTLE